MYQIDTSDSVTTKPTPAAAGTKGWFRKNDGVGTLGTVISADWMNHVNGELAAILAKAGVAQDKTKTDQIADALAAWSEIGGVISDLLDTGATSNTVHPRVLVGTIGNSRSTGNPSLCAATSGALAAGPRTATLACTNANVTANASDAAVIASDSNSTTNLKNEGDACLIAASSGSAAGPIAIANGADTCAVLACSGGAVDVSATSIACAMLACRGGELKAGSSASALIASSWDQTPGSISDDPKISGSNCVIAGVDGDIELTGTNAVLLASSVGTGAGTVATSNAALFYNAAGETARIESNTGRGVFAFLTMSDVNATTGGSPTGAKPNLPTGATGTNFQWIKINDGTADFWIPSWSNA
jgi:hypothetical protein